MSRLLEALVFVCFFHVGFSCSKDCNSPGECKPDRDCFCGFPPDIDCALHFRIQSEQPHYLAFKWGFGVTSIVITLVGSWKLFFVVKSKGKRRTWDVQVRCMSIATFGSAVRVIVLLTDPFHWEGTYVNNLNAIYAVPFATLIVSYVMMVYMWLNFERRYPGSNDGWCIRNQARVLKYSTIIFLLVAFTAGLLVYVVYALVFELFVWYLIILTVVFGGRLMIQLEPNNTARMRSLRRMTYFVFGGSSVAVVWMIFFAIASGLDLYDGAAPEVFLGVKSCYLSFECCIVLIIFFSLGNKQQSQLDQKSKSNTNSGARDPAASRCSTKDNSLAVV